MGTICLSGEVTLSARHTVEGVWFKPSASIRSMWSLGNIESPSGFLAFLILSFYVALFEFCVLPLHGPSLPLPGCCADALAMHAACSVSPGRNMWPLQGKLLDLYS